jgi:hypothetical protein
VEVERFKNSSLASVISAGEYGDGCDTGQLKVAKTAEVLYLKARVHATRISRAWLAIPVLLMYRRTLGRSQAREWGTPSVSPCVQDK